MKYREIKKAIPQTTEARPQVQETVRSILEKVHQEGDRAIAYYEKKFDQYEPETFLFQRKKPPLQKINCPVILLMKLIIPLRELHHLPGFKETVLLNLKRSYTPAKLSVKN